MKKVIRRVLAVLPAAAIQAVWFYLTLSLLASYSAGLSVVLTVFAVILEMYILTSREERMGLISVWQPLQYRLRRQAPAPVIV